MAKKKQNRRLPIPKAEAFERMDSIIKLIEKNVQVALRVEAALETANAVVRDELNGVKYYGAGCYNTVAHCIAINWR